MSALSPGIGGIGFDLAIEVRREIESTKANFKNLIFFSLSFLMFGVGDVKAGFVVKLQKSLVVGEK